MIINNIKKLMIIAGVLPLAQLILAILNPYNYYKLNDSIIYFVIEYLLSYFIVTMIFFYFFLKKNKINIFSETSIKKIEIQLIYIIFLLELILVSSNLYTMYTGGMSLQEARDAFFFSQIYGTNIKFGDIVLFIWIIQGLRVTIFIHVTKNFLLNPTRLNRRYFLLLSCSFILADLSNGGRINTFYFISILFIVYIVLGQKLISCSAFKLIVKIFFFGFLFTFLISLIRVESNSTFIYFLYKYFIGPLFLFQQAILDNNGLLDNDEIRFGMILSSFDWALVGFLKIMSFCDCRTIATIIDPIMATGYYFSDIDGGNAFFTGFFSSYLDFGPIGGVVLGFLIPITIFFITSRLIKSPTNFKFDLLILAGLAAIMMFRENLLANPWILFAFIFSLIFSKFNPL